MDSVNTDIYSRSQHYRQAMCNSLTADAAKPLIQAFVSCCLDYCNSLLYGVPDSLIRKLQSVQNAAACLTTGARWCDHITQVLQQLHWLPVRRRVDYKVACLVHQSLSGHAPRYLADDINLVANSGRHLLRSAYDRTCAVPWTCTGFSDRSFSIAGPRVECFATVFVTRH